MSEVKRGYGQHAARVLPMLNHDFGKALEALKTAQERIRELEAKLTRVKELADAYNVGTSVTHYVHPQCVADTIRAVLDDD